MYDKRAAKRHGQRIAERSLLTIAALGGAFAMLLSMLAIRHKTRHVKFMLGLPAILLAQAAVIIALVLWQARV